MKKIVITGTDDLFWACELDERGMTDGGLIVKALHKFWHDGHGEDSIAKIEVEDV